jgi:hypothetical protein
MEEQRVKMTRRKMKKTSHYPTSRTSTMKRRRTSSPTNALQSTTPQPSPPP